MKHLITALFMATIATGASHARETDKTGAVMPIAVNIIQCGLKSEIEQMCKIQPACCVFIEPSAGGETGPDENAIEHCEIYQLQNDGSFPVCVKVYQ